MMNTTPVPPSPEPDSSGSSRSRAAASDEGRLATVPNALSLARILAIPVFVALLVRPGTELAGLLTLAVVASTDWVDGFIARRTGQVSKAGKLLDPVADRLALGAALVTFLYRGVVPPWAAALVLARDAVVLAAAVVVALRFKKTIEVRPIGKAATFALMFGIPAIAWANFGLFPSRLAYMAGWASFWPGLVGYYVAAGLYWSDLRRAVSPGAR